MNAMRIQSKDPLMKINEDVAEKCQLTEDKEKKSR